MYPRVESPIICSRLMGLGGLRTGDAERPRAFRERRVRRRDDPRALQHGVNQREVRPAELVGEKPVHGRRVREDDPVGFAVVPARTPSTLRDPEYQYEFVKRCGVVLHGSILTNLTSLNVSEAETNELLNREGAFSNCSTTRSL